MYFGEQYGTERGGVGTRDDRNSASQCRLDFQKSPSSDFIWRGTSRDFVARGRPLRGQKRLAPLAKRGRLVASLSVGLLRGFFALKWR